jgi:hypothetical protein
MLCVPVKTTNYLPEIPPYTDIMKALRRMEEGSG